MVKKKEHKCDSCSRAYSYAKDLKRHINSVHIGRRDHKCDFCGKAFSAGQSLKKHIHSDHNAQEE